jgi:hypothetical protein
MSRAAIVLLSLSAGAAGLLAQSPPTTNPNRRTPRRPIRTRLHRRRQRRMHRRGAAVAVGEGGEARR